METIYAGPPVKYFCGETLEYRNGTAFVFSDTQWVRTSSGHAIVRDDKTGCVFICEFDELVQPKLLVAKGKAKKQ